MNLFEIWEECDRDFVTVKLLRSLYHSRRSFASLKLLLYYAQTPIIERSKESFKIKKISK